MQIAVDDLVPFPVVVDRLDGQRDKNQPPKSEVEIGEADVGGADADDAEEDKAEGIGQLKSIACLRFRRGCRVPFQPVRSRLQGVAGRLLKWTAVAGDPPRMMTSSQNL